MVDWLTTSENYEPERDSERFIRKTSLGLASALRALRFDAGISNAWSPSALFKLIGMLVLVVLNSLSSNFLFTEVLLALVLLRICILPSDSYTRTCAVTFGAVALAAIVMVPALFLGQPQSLVRIVAKTFVSSGLVMLVANTTQSHELTASLRAFKVPSSAILAIDLALKNIVNLGTIALEMLSALRLRSVGRNSNKSGSFGGVGGVLLLKTAQAAQDTFDAMQCRGFTGDIPYGAVRRFRKIDIAWALGLALCVAFFIYTQGLM